jgi:DMSO/TMAO reductase YedYZ heme-binding membrane subunit
MKVQRIGFLEGWRLTGLLGLAVLAYTLALSWAEGGGIDGIRLAIRHTAWTSFLLFLFAFTASSMVRLRPARFTKWQLRNRRYLGVSFAISHLIHAVALVMLYQADRALFWTLTAPGNVIGGGIAYVFILLMTVTSFDRTAAWLGRDRWRILHKAGVWYVWLIFMIGFGKRIPTGDHYIAPFVILVLAAALRFAVWRSARRSKPASTALPSQV